jgi:hypothetical protein
MVQPIDTLDYDDNDEDPEFDAEDSNDEGYYKV